MAGSLFGGGMMPGMGQGGAPGGGGLMGNMGLSFKPYNMPGGGAIFANPEEAFMKQQMNAAAQAYGQYRPEMAQARQNAMRGTLQGLNPYNAAMSMMYGSQFQQLPQVGNPMSERMMGIGNTAMPGTSGQGTFQQNGIMQRMLPFLPWASSNGQGPASPPPPNYHPQQATQGGQQQAAPSMMGGLAQQYTRRGPETPEEAGRQGVLYNTPLHKRKP